MGPNRRCSEAVAKSLDFILSYMGSCWRTVRKARLGPDVSYLLCFKGILYK